MFLNKFIFVIFHITDKIPVKEFAYVSVFKVVSGCVMRRGPGGDYQGNPVFVLVIQIGCCIKVVFQFSDFIVKHDLNLRDWLYASGLIPFDGDEMVTQHNSGYCVKI